MTKKEQLLNEYGQLSIAIQQLQMKQGLIRLKLLGKEPTNIEVTQAAHKARLNGNGKRRRNPQLNENGMGPKQQKLYDVFKKVGGPLKIEEIRVKLGYKDKQAVYNLVHSMKKNKLIQGANGIYELRD